MSEKNENIKILQRKIDYQHAELVDVRKINTKLRSELAACKSERDALQARIDGAVKFIKNIRDNYDCDPDAHKYGTPCRCCEATKILREESEG